MAKQQRAHWLQHVRYEGLGQIAPWLQQQQFEVRHTALWAGEALPDLQQMDWLIVMGGPMNVYQQDLHPWLEAERQLIYDACVTKRVKVLGICLGAQQIAAALGAKVVQNEEKEIGWYAVEKNDVGARCSLFDNFPSTFDAFHWHGDRFELPEGTRNLMSSAACAHQAFKWGDRVVALQFHLEAEAADAALWADLASPKPARFVQSKAEMLQRPERYVASHRLLQDLLLQMQRI